MELRRKCIQKAHHELSYSRRFIEVKILEDT